jgi:hypothetical protein
VFDRSAHFAVGKSAHRLSERKHYACIDLVKGEIGDSDI